MLVEVRPIARKKWHEKTEKDDFSRPMSIEVLYDHTIGKYATGLTEEERVKMEAVLGVNLSDKFDPSIPHEYWSTQAAKIKLPNHTILFDTAKPTDYVKVKNLKASKFIANSMKEYEEGLFPEATHVIFDETEEAEIKATKIERKLEAYTLLAKMTREMKNSIIQILSEKTVRKQSDSFIVVEIENIINSDADNFLKYAKMDKKETATRAAILEALYRNILRKEGGAIFYMSDKLAMDYESAVVWFLNPDNQEMKVRILEKINEK